MVCVVGWEVNMWVSRRHVEVPEMCVKCVWWSNVLASINNCDKFSFPKKQTDFISLVFLGNSSSPSFFIIFPWKILLSFSFWETKTAPFCLIKESNNWGSEDIQQGMTGIDRRSWTNRAKNHFPRYLSQVSMVYF
jgi:hypothetical protein